jgi:hypothetical protein
MTEQEQADRELLARMRAADPAASLAPVGTDEVGRLLGEAMSEQTLTESRETGIRHRSPLTWLVAAAAVVLIAAAAVFALTQRGATPSRPPAAQPSASPHQPATLELTLPTAAGSGRCMVPQPSVLARADVALDAEAVEVSEGVVTLQPTRFYAGGPAEHVRVDQGSASMRDLIGAVRFEEGGRYLVAADGGEVLVCGFSGAYDADLAGLYAEAFTR